MKNIHFVLAILFLPVLIHAQVEGTLLKIDKDSTNDLSLEISSAGVYQIHTMGQDPYINAGEAMGLSFSVPPGGCACA